MRMLLALAALLVAVFSGSAAHATFPDKPITLIIPFQSTYEVNAIVAKGLERQLGVRVIVETHPGPAGLRAMFDLLQAKPDGYTLTMATGPNLIMTFYKKKPFDVSKVAFVGMTFAFQPPVLVTSDSFKGSLNDFIDLMRRKGPAFTWASGTRTTSHMAGLQFMTAANAHATHQETRNANLSFAMLLGNHVDAAIESGSLVGAALDHGSHMRVLAVLSNEHQPAFPNIAIPKDVGIEGDFRLTAANVLVAPPSTPPKVVEKLRIALFGAMHDPAVVSQLRTLHYDPLATALPQMETAARTWLRNETAEWDRVFKLYKFELLDPAVN